MKVGYSSSGKKSKLARLFAKRVGISPDDPKTTISFLVNKLHHGLSSLPGVTQIENTFETRRIHICQYKESIKYDGLLQPLGESFAEGFGLILRRDIAPTRIRFTAAHEVCHTFFYEYVPDLKFGASAVDADEERLCNIGAAEFLMPSKSVQEEAAKTRIGLKSLGNLASQFSVSNEAMMSRLRSLKVWSCELTSWHRGIDGRFLLDRLIGGKQQDWKWVDNTIPLSAWESSCLRRGHTFVKIRDKYGVERVKPVSYEIQRKGNSLKALWGKLATHGNLESSLFKNPPRSERNQSEWILRPT